MDYPIYILDTYKSCEHVVVSVVIHLELQYLKWKVRLMNKLTNSSCLSCKSDLLIIVFYIRLREINPSRFKLIFKRYLSRDEINNNHCKVTIIYEISQTLTNQAKARRVSKQNFQLRSQYHLSSFSSSYSSES